METYNDLNFSKFRIIKNAITLSIVFFITFTAYDCLGMLQSTLNHHKGIGVASLSITYALFCFSSVLFPKYFIQKLGSKRTLVISMCCYIPYIAANVYPHWYFMIPAGIISGLSASLVWASQCTYLNDIAIMYVTFLQNEKNNNVKQTLAQNTENVFHVSFNHTHGENDIKILDASNETSSTGNHVSVLSVGHLTSDTSNDTKEAKTYNALSAHRQFEEPISSVPQTSGTIISTSDVLSIPPKIVEATTARFFGIFGMAYLSSHMWSNLMSYFVLQNGISHSNIIFNTSCVCGAKFCNEESDCFLHNLQEPSPETRKFLTGLCVGLALASILILMLCLDSLNDKRENVNFSLKLLMATYKQSKKKLQILLIPISYYVGMMQGFYASDFTVSYVGCAWGTYHVSLVTVCYGAACSISSSLSGVLMKRIGRIPIFLIAALVTIAAQVLLLIWNPTAENPAMFFIIAGLWGAALGVLWSQIKAIHGLLFKEDEEAAFAAFHVWYSLGFCISFAYSNRLCTYVQIYILLVVLIVGMIGYLWLEFLIRCQMKRL